MTDRAAQYRLDQRAAHERTLAYLRGETIERTPELQRADQAVDQMLACMMSRELSDRERERLDNVWAQLCAEAAFTRPGVEQVQLLERAARELVECEVSPDLGGPMLEGLAAMLGLGPQAVSDAISAARVV
jgi:hypothetical protein